MKSSEYNANRQTTYIMQKLMFVIKYTLLLLAQIESLGSAPAAEPMRTGTVDTRPPIQHPSHP